MAIFSKELPCPLCHKQLRTDNPICFHHFLPYFHSLWQYSDACFHRECFEAWEHSERYTNIYERADLLQKEIRKRRGNAESAESKEARAEDDSSELYNQIVAEDRDFISRHLKNPVPVSPALKALRDRPCVDCGSPHRQNIGQSYVTNRLTWYCSDRCFCKATEEDGWGFPPDYLRLQLAMREGIGAVLLTAKARETVATARILRLLKRELSLSQADTTTLFRRLPLLFTGTRTEAEWMSRLLAAEGVETRIDAVTEYDPDTFRKESVRK